MPPADIIPEIIRSIVIFQNITNAGIIFDDSIGKTAFLVILAQLSLSSLLKFGVDVTVSIFEK
jgi:hypothetical protein